MFATKKLKKRLATLLTVAILGTTVFYTHNASAQYTQAECDAARQACEDARDTAIFVCASAWFEPTPLLELGCVYFGTKWVLKCAYADEVCSRVNGG